MEDKNNKLKSQSVDPTLMTLIVWSVQAVFQFFVTMGFAWIWRKMWAKAKVWYYNKKIDNSDKKR